MEQELQGALRELAQKLDEILASTERTRKIMLWMIILSISAALLPLVGLLFILPMLSGLTTI